MAILTKTAASRLTEDTSTLMDSTRSWLHPHVSYDKQQLAAISLASGGNAAIAMELSGTSDKKSKAYKAALRSVEIWQKTDRKPGVKYRGKIIELAARHGAISEDDYINAAGTVKGSSNVSISGYIQISQTVEHRTLHTTLSGTDLQEFLALAASGNQDDALALFATEGTSRYPLFSVYGDNNNPVRVTFS